MGGGKPLIFAAFPRSRKIILQIGTIPLPNRRFQGAGYTIPIELRKF